MPVSLSAGTIEVISLGGVPAETHDAIAAVSMEVNFAGHNVSIAFMSGTPADNTFTPGLRGIAYAAQIDTLTGAWTASNGTSGTLTGPQLALLNGNLKNARNGAEGLANALGLLPGTPVVWT